MADIAVGNRTDQRGWGEVHRSWRDLVFAERRNWPRHPALRVVDLFCSAGGLSLGLAESAASLGFGAKFVAAVDIDLKALQVYAKNLRASEVIHGSVNDFVRFEVKSDRGESYFASAPKLLPPLLHHVGEIDVLIGGPPCQGHSGLNNLTRGSDPRNSLYISAVAIAIALDVRHLILENVPEIRRSHLDVVETSLALLRASGYHTDDGVLMASEIGWPQSRKRHFLVASKRGLVPLSSLVTEFRERSPGAADFLRCLPQRGGGLDLVPEYSEVTKRRIQFFEENPDVYELPLSERPDCHKQGTTYGSVYGRMRPDEPVPTLTTGFLTPGRGRFVHPELPRTLTLGEGAYVQGFPSWFELELPGVSRQELTKWIGDAVPLPLGFVAAQAVLRSLLT